MHTRYDRAIATYRHRFLNERMKDQNISVPEGKLLVMIHHSGDFPLNELIDKSFFHKSHVTRSINGLKEKGYIRKKVNPDDRRTFIVSITEKGRSTAKNIVDVFEEWQAIVNGVLTDDERACIKRAKKKIYEKVHALFSEGGDGE